ncbi:stage III sporulation protein AF [Clostridium saccharoperbutylacetonicum]|jgi:stage III sporulation protein AF|uniref:Stage III sporulation protein AF n=1 Tax=Clostridium saccharoperbutylacetonicum N1-4(HMT) TaxID=931276 RepID=M1MF05_9CLOT|nr:stage III sporulation protein AF [Clostridium saccharoperbutylacetonicum]AGF56504.1 stage III sporulation protein AF [Clostridium saccharoperbutylacetonicum N1-4(HMT)]AQR95173.1 stage III sporulation protein SpoIIIAF [Clostridium saccharoperbutylacetonicum]NRT62749.1 stage III sporulation protein AF [Clostridium saccharoperbutylacetonicum]NSB26101.1 stage III sporulation protein AF [Clostridium saccharoperbutylacetonicum]NSB31020.1 stage III sporulation protein AF [Clostridium saccharoperbu
MFIDVLKNIVITIVTVLIFISAVEIMVPSNKMKKYVNFVLGLILISVILSPIVKFLSNGDKEIVNSIKSYEEIFTDNQNKFKSDNVSTLKNNGKEDTKKELFIRNFNKNCEDLLKNKFKEMTFKSELECDVDFNNITFNIKKLRIGIADSKVNKIKKVRINKEKTDNKEENEEYSEVVNYISNQLDIPKEKIEIYKLEE